MQSRIPRKTLSTSVLGEIFITKWGFGFLHYESGEFHDGFWTEENAEVSLAEFDSYFQKGKDRFHANDNQ